jgi:hypothetical protein
MKFSISLATAVLATSAYAQIDVVQGVLDDVKSGIGSVGTAVQGFNGESGPLIDASEALVGTLTDGKTTVDGSSDLSLEDALGLQDPVKDLTTAAQSLVDELKAKKSAIAEGGFCDETREQITNINTASNSLIDAVVAKVPSAAQPIAEGLVADLKSVLQEAQDEFSEANCQNTGGGEESSSEPAPTSTGGGGDDSSAPPTATPTQSGGSGGGDSSASPTVSPTGSHVPTNSGITTATTTSSSGNGTSTHTSTPPVVTGGAGAIVPAGALALGFAVLLV